MKNNGRGYGNNRCRSSCSNCGGSSIGRTAEELEIDAAIAAVAVLVVVVTAAVAEL